VLQVKIALVVVTLVPVNLVLVEDGEKLVTMIASFGMAFGDGANIASNSSLRRFSTLLLLFTACVV